MGCGGSKKADDSKTSSKTSSAASQAGGSKTENDGSGSGELSLTDLADLQGYLSRNEFFARTSTSGVLRVNLANAFAKRSFKEAEVIVEQGSVGTEFYIIASGSAAVAVDDIPIAVLRKGNGFGEQALLSKDSKRKATVVALESTACFVLSKAKLESATGMPCLKVLKKRTVALAAKSTSSGSKKVPEVTKSKETAELLCKTLQANTNLSMILGELTKHQVNAAVEAMSKMSVSVGEAIITQGELDANKFYLVESGKFEVYIGNSEGQTVEETASCVLQESEPLGNGGETQQRRLSSEDERRNNSFVNSQKQGRPTLADLKATKDNRKSIAALAEGGLGQTLIGERGVGSSFGELALIHPAPRAATVKCVEEAQVWVLEKADFRRCLFEFAEKQADKYCKLLKSGDLMKNLSKEELRAVSQECVERHFPDGSNVITEGEIGDSFYVIVAGRCDVIVGEELVKSLSRGDCFGERALLNNEKRAATIKVPPDTGGAWLLCLDQEAFEEILGKSLFLRTKNLYLQEGDGNIPVIQAEELPSKEQIVVAPSALTEIGLLGMGEFGPVTLMRDEDDKTTFALKKVLKKDLQRTERALREFEVLERCRSDFVVNLLLAFRDEKSFNFVLAPCLGGSLLTACSKSGLYGNAHAAQFYAACVIVALQDLHESQIIHRDIRIENLLLDERGYGRLSSLGLAKRTICRTYTFCGALDCLAPEMVSLKTGYGRAVDWWALGVFIFEIMAESGPFDADDPMTIFRNINSGIKGLKWPENCPGQVKSAITGFLTPQPRERLGVKGKIDGLLEHGWFTGFDWQQLRAKTMAPAHEVSVSGNEDVSNFEEPDRRKANALQSLTDVDVKQFIQDDRFGRSLADLEAEVKARKARGETPPFQVPSETSDKFQLPDKATGNAEKKEDSMPESSAASDASTAAPEVAAMQLMAQTASQGPPDDTDHIMPLIAPLTPNTPMIEFIDKEESLEESLRDKIRTVRSQGEAIVKECKDMRLCTGCSCEISKLQFLASAALSGNAPRRQMPSDVMETPS